MFSPLFSSLSFFFFFRFFLFFFLQASSLSKPSGSLFAAFKGAIKCDVWESKQANSHRNTHSVMQADTLTEELQKQARQKYALALQQGCNHGSWSVEWEGWGLWAFISLGDRMHANSHIHNTHRGISVS